MLYNYTYLICHSANYNPVGYKIQLADTPIAVWT